MGHAPPWLTGSDCPQSTATTTTTTHHAYPESLNEHAPAFSALSDFLFADAVPAVSPSYRQVIDAVPSVEMVRFTNR